MQNLNDLYELRQFVGGGHAYDGQFILTDGARYVVQKYGIRWLLDFIYSLRAITPGAENCLNVVKLKTDRDNGFMVVSINYEDCDGREKTESKTIEHCSEFPADSELTLYFGMDNIFCLPCED